MFTQLLGATRLQRTLIVLSVTFTVSLMGLMLLGSGWGQTLEKTAWPLVLIGGIGVVWVGLVISSALLFRASTPQTRSQAALTLGLNVVINSMLALYAASSLYLGATFGPPDQFFTANQARFEAAAQQIESGARPADVKQLTGEYADLSSSLQNPGRVAAVRAGDDLQIHFFARDAGYQRSWIIMYSNTDTAPTTPIVGEAIGQVERLAPHWFRYWAEGW